MILLKNIRKGEIIMLFIKKRKEIYIEGMSCEHCKKKVKNALENLMDVTKVKVDLKKKCAVVTYENSVDDSLLQETVEDLGYTVTGVKNLS